MQKTPREVLVEIALSPNAAVGKYTVQIAIETDKVHRTRVPIVIFVNPYKSADAAYASSSYRAEYVENTQGLIWQGLSDNNEGFAFAYDQFEWANVLIAIRSLRRMPLEDRGNFWCCFRATYLTLRARIYATESGAKDRTRRGVLLGDTDAQARRHAMALVTGFL